MSRFANAKLLPLTPAIQYFLLHRSPLLVRDENARKPRRWYHRFIKRPLQKPPGAILTAIAVGSLTRHETWCTTSFLAAGQSLPVGDLGRAFGKLWPGKRLPMNADLDALTVFNRMLSRTELASVLESSTQSIAAAIAEMTGRKLTNLEKEIYDIALNGNDR